MQLAKLTFLIAGIISVNLSYGQGDEQVIKNIRQEYYRINEHNNLTQFELENEEFLEHMTDGGGSLTGYYEEEELVKVVEWIGLSFGKVVTEYYLKNGELFFAFQSEDHFPSKYDSDGTWMGFDPFQAGFENKYEGRYYFYNKQLIRELDKGERVMSDYFKYDSFTLHLEELVEVLEMNKN